MFKSPFDVFSILDESIESLKQKLISSAKNKESQDHLENLEHAQNLKDQLRFRFIQTNDAIKESSRFLTNQESIKHYLEDVKVKTTLDDCFSCTCGVDDHYFMLEYSQEDELTISLHEKYNNYSFFNRVKFAWNLLIGKWLDIYVILDKQENHRFKEFVSRLKEVDCRNCNPDYPNE